MENLFLAWEEFAKGKMKKKDVLEFKLNLEDNICNLHKELANKAYQHSDYIAFNVFDPKLRRIHKATVKDRILHHAVFRILYLIFDRSFIFDSYSCRKNKGTHKGVKRFEEFYGKASKNHKRRIFALKCDIKKFFDSVDQEILLELIQKKICDRDAVWLIKKIIKSFSQGLPLGNVTSQLFANIYLNELDQFVKHKLKTRYYLRYCDDFVFLDENEKCLRELILKVDNFLIKKLKLNLHPRKIIIRKYGQGVDFLGFVVLPYHRVVRTKTKKRMFKKLKMRVKEYKAGKISRESLDQALQSYLGVLSHADTYNSRQELLNKFWFWMSN